MLHSLDNIPYILIIDVNFIAYTSNQAFSDKNNNQ